MNALMQRLEEGQRKLFEQQMADALMRQREVFQQQVAEISRDLQDRVDQEVGRQVAPLIEQQNVMQVEAQELRKKRSNSSRTDWHHLSCAPLLSLSRAAQLSKVLGRVNAAHWPQSLQTSLSPRSTKWQHVKCQNETKLTRRHERRRPSMPS